MHVRKHIQITLSEEETSNINTNLLIEGHQKLSCYICTVLISLQVKDSDFMAQRNNGTVSIIPGKWIKSKKCATILTLLLLLLTLSPILKYFNYIFILSFYIAITSKLKITDSNILPTYSWLYLYVMCFSSLTINEILSTTEGKMCLEASSNPAPSMGPKDTL